jgi:hypothetical protein
MANRWDHSWNGPSESASTGREILPSPEADTPRLSLPDIAKSQPSMSRSETSNRSAFLNRCLKMIILTSGIWGKRYVGWPRIVAEGWYEEREGSARKDCVHDAYQP